MEVLPGACEAGVGCMSGACRVPLGACRCSAVRCGAQPHPPFGGAEGVQWFEGNLLGGGLKGRRDGCGCLAARQQQQITIVTKNHSSLGIV